MAGSFGWSCSLTGFYRGKDAECEKILGSLSWVTAAACTLGLCGEGAQQKFSEGLPSAFNSRQRYSEGCTWKKEQQLTAFAETTPGELEQTTCQVYFCPTPTPCPGFSNVSGIAKNLFCFLSVYFCFIDYKH